MGDELEAIGTMAEAAMVGSAVEKATGEKLDSHSDGTCLNCGAVRQGSYCSHCGQSSHIHRSISAFWHDILHGVLHFDGKFWRTLPLLAWQPGKLTKRYIHGERAKFISPMALFLFTIFMMFAIFSFMPVGSDGIDDGSFNKQIEDSAEDLDTQIAATEKKLDDAELSAAGRKGLEQGLIELKEARNGISYMQAGEPLYPDIGSKVNDGDLTVSADNSANTGWPWLDAKLEKGMKKSQTNPDLLFYKIKSNGYKFAWLLIPLSIPFVWLVTIGVRGHRFYDHAVFTTYSLAFMSLMFVCASILAAIGLPWSLMIVIMTFYAPFHLYRQLRHAYGLSRLGTLIRLCFLIGFIFVTLLLFTFVLLLLGMLS